MFGDMGKISTFLHAEVLRAPSTTLHLVASLRLARMFLLRHLPREAEPSACVLVRDRLPALLDLAFKRASRQLKIGLKERKRKRLEDGSEDWTWARSVSRSFSALGFDPFPSPFYPRLQATASGLTPRFEQLTRAARSWQSKVRLEQEEARGLLLSLQPCNLVFDRQPITSTGQDRDIFGPAALEFSGEEEEEEVSDEGAVDFAGRLIQLTRFPAAWSNEAVGILVAQIQTSIKPVSAVATPPQFFFIPSCCVGTRGKPSSHDRGRG